jgi:hypothetical protein
MTINTQNTTVAVRGGLLRRLWNDDCGALLATEWIFVATLLVIGIIPGLIAIRQGALNGLVDFANGVGALDQSYSFSGQRLECNCWDRNGKDLRGTERDRFRSGLNGRTDRTDRDRVTGRGDHREWQRTWAIAETSGSRYVKTQRPPLQLKQTNPATTEIGQVKGCN